MSKFFVTFWTAVVAVLALACLATAAHAVEHRRAPAAPYGLTRAVVAEWRVVNRCEEGGRWHVRGRIYDGGLGIDHVNWNRNRPWWVDPLEWRATALEQIVVARRIEAAGGAPGFVPDQDGRCTAW